MLRYVFQLRLLGMFGYAQPSYARLGYAMLCDTLLRYAIRAPRKIRDFRPPRLGPHVKYETFGHHA